MTFIGKTRLPMNGECPKCGMPVHIDANGVAKNVFGHRHRYTCAGGIRWSGAGKRPDDFGGKFGEHPADRED